MYPNQNAMGYPNQARSQMAEQLLFQNQSNAAIADIYTALDTAGKHEYSQYGRSSSYRAGHYSAPDYGAFEQKQSDGNRYEKAGGNAD